MHALAQARLVGQQAEQRRAECADQADQSQQEAENCPAPQPGPKER